MDLPELLSMIRGYQPAQIILTAHRLGVFKWLGDRAYAVEEIATGLATSARGTRILLDALTAIGVVEKQADRYQNTLTTRTFCSGIGHEDRSTSLNHYADLMHIWSRLDESVRTGVSCRLPLEHLTQGEAKHNAVFIGAMAEIGRPNARIIAQTLDLSPFRRLVDIGGGPGVYAEEFLRNNPHMTALIADLPLTIQSAQPLVAGGEFAHRIEFIAFDAYNDKDTLDEPFDLALVSNVLHMEGETKNRQLLQTIHQAMQPGGMIILHEKIIAPNRTTPTDAALFAVNMLVNTQRGDCYSKEEMEAWLLEAGFTHIQLVDCFVHPSLITARKL